MDAEIHCRRINEMLPWYVNRSLPDRDVEIVGTHLRDCESCRGEAEWLARVGRHLRESPVKPPHAAAFDALRFRIEGDRQRVQRTHFALAAGLLLAFAVTVGLVLAPYAFAPRYGTVTDAVQPAAQVVVLELTLKENEPVSSLHDVLGQYNADIIDGPAADGSLLLEFRLAGGESEQGLWRRLEKDPRVATLSTPAVD